MTKILYDTINQKVIPYPRNDDNPIEGLSTDYLVLDVIESVPVDYDIETHTIRESKTVNIERLEYRKEWVLDAIESAPIQDWPSFSLYLFGHPAFVGYGLAAESVNPWIVPAVVERYGRVLPEGIVASNFPFYWGLFCQALSVSTDHRNEWADVALSFNLPADFVALLRG
jgi:hypothetical protein